MKFDTAKGSYYTIFEKTSGTKLEIEQTGSAEISKRSYMFWSYVQVLKYLFEKYEVPKKIDL